jgi:PAS domain S-box-containing protein
MNYQKKLPEEINQELLELKNENEKLKGLISDCILRNKYSEELLTSQSQWFAKLSKYSIELSNQSQESISTFIVNEFKALFKVKEAWISIYDEEKLELVLKATTLSESDNSKIVQRFGKSFIGRKTPIDPKVYKTMVDIGIGEPSTMHEISFGQIPVFISSAIEKLFSIGWFQGVTLTDKGKLYGGLLVAGYTDQEKLNRNELKIFSEITSNVLRKQQIEKELVTSETRFRQLSELLPQLVFETDIQGNITFANQFGLKLLGYNSDVLKSGLNIVNLIVKEERDNVAAKILNFHESSESAAEEYLVIKKNGETFPLFLHAEPYFEDGRLKGLRGTGVDISNLRRAEALLADERNLLRTIIDNIPDIIFAKDIQSRFLICNDALVKRVGKESENQVIGKSDLELLPKANASKYFAEEQLIFNSGKPIINSEQSVITSSGQLKYNLMTKVPFRNNHGKIIGLVGIGRDITSRKQAENEVRYKNEQLQKSNSEKDKFFSIIAHDLRSPFNHFLGFTQIISEELSTLSQEQIQNIADNMKKSATNLYSLLENLLEWAKMQRGLMEFKPERFNLHERISGCVDLIIGPAKAKSISVSYDIPRNYEIMADKHMFDTIIRNLVSNAIKFTRRKGEIHISAETGEVGLTEIRIKDTGIGMNKELLNNLFILDQQTSRKGTDNEPSTGLGLLLCKEFIEKHDGKIWVESEVGKGSTFSFSVKSFESSES